MRIILKSNLGESVIASGVSTERICDVLRLASLTYLGKRVRPNYATMRAETPGGGAVVFAQRESDALIS